MFSSLKCYANKHIIWVFINGIASGFPWVIIGSCMTLWLKDAGLSRSAIGFFGSIFAVYTFNFLWAPLVDNFRLPFLFKKFGQRRSWMIFAQATIGISTVCLAFTDPQNSIVWTSLLALMVATAGATQDIAIDAYRIDVIGKKEANLQAAGAAMATSGWWTGYSLIGAIALFIVDFNNWQITYFFLAFIAFASMCFSMFLYEPLAKEREQQLQAALQKYQFTGVLQIFSYVAAIVFEPLRDFFARYKSIAITILLFILLFKIGEAFLGRMSLVFYSEIGFDKSEIATYSKLINWWVTIIFSIVSGSFIMRFGLVKGLLFSGIAMASTNLLFAAMAMVGNEAWLFILTVILDGFTSSFSTVAFVAFISYLTSSAFSATQYALMASMGNFGRVILASSSGALVDYLDGDWSLFFIITTFMVIPSLLCLVYLANKLGIWQQK